MIPYQAVPQAYDPPSHLIATGNQRPVSGDYPYYVGTALDFYDPGYRAAHAYSALKAAEPLTAASIAALQNDLTDPLAARLLPAVLQRAVRRRPVRCRHSRRRRCCRPGTTAWTRGRPRRRCGGRSGATT